MPGASAQDNCNSGRSFFRRATSLATLQSDKKLEQLLDEFHRLHAAGIPVRLGKSTSNLFRSRSRAPGRKLDVSAFNQVLSVDRERKLAQVEGMTTYEAFVEETLKHGLLPAVVPQLKTITVGGAVSGVGIESSSFRFGLVHETLEDMDILVGDGRVIHCSRTENADLFYGFPNSYGTLGYALRLTMRLIPALPYVHVQHRRFSDLDAYFARVQQTCETCGPDYLDGAIFGPDEIYLTTGEFSPAAPTLSNYKWLNIYYKSIRSKEQDWLTSEDYIWRWDTDWFWCSKQFYADSALVRFIATPLLLNSLTYQRIMRLSQRFLPDSGKTESVIQDVDIPIENAAEFLQFLLETVPISPIWMCPIRAGAETFPLYDLAPGKVYINFGFWDVIPSAGEAGYYNRAVEQKALALGGKKGLYSSSYYDVETFWRIYNGSCYRELKRKYDPDKVFGDLYEKCVLKL